MPLPDRFQGKREEAVSRVVSGQQGTKDSVCKRIPTEEEMRIIGTIIRAVRDVLIPTPPIVTGRFLARNEAVKRWLKDQ